MAKLNSTVSVEQAQQKATEDRQSQKDDVMLQSILNTTRSNSATPVLDEAQSRAPVLNIKAFGADSSGAARTGLAVGAGVKQSAASYLNLAGAFTPGNLTIGEEVRAGNTEAERQKAMQEKKANTQEKIYGAADKLADSAQADIEKANEGASKLGKTLNSVATAGTQLIGDIGMNAIAPGSGLWAMGARTFGSAAQEARRNGATENQQFAYAAANTAVEVLTEKLFGGLISGEEGLIAKGLTKTKGGQALVNLLRNNGGTKLVQDVVDKVSQKAAGRIAVNAVKDFAGEGFEEFVSGIAQPLLDSIYNGKGIAENYSELDWQNVLEEVMVGGILGAIGGGTEGVVRPSNIGGAQTAQEAAPNAAAQRTNTAEGNLTAEAQSASTAQEMASTAIGNAVSAVRDGGTVTNSVAERIISTDGALAQLGVDPNGKTASQLRGAVKDAIAQMAASETATAQQTAQPMNEGIAAAGLMVNGRPGITPQNVETQQSAAADIGEDALAQQAKSADSDALAQMWFGGNQEATPQGVNSVPMDNLGSARAGFETPDSRSQERTSNLESGSLKYNSARGEASALTKEAYDALFKYQSITEEQSLNAAENVLYYNVPNEDGTTTRTFLADIDPDAYADVVKSLEDAPAWDGKMTDAAYLIEQELMSRSQNMEIADDVYTAWLNTIREHETNTGRGIQAVSKWTRGERDGSKAGGNGGASRVDAWETLQQSDLTPEERMERFSQICKFDTAIEKADNQGALVDLVIDISNQRGTLNGLTGKQSKRLESIARKTLSGLTPPELKCFAYECSASLATDTQPANIGQKIKTVQVLNMLSNPKTGASNIAGNTTFYGIDAMAMRGAAIIDMALSKITGTRSVAMEKFALNKEGRQAIDTAIKRSAAEVLMDVDMDGTNRYGTSGRRTFKMDGRGVLNTGKGVDKAAERVMSTLERNMGFVLNTTDEAYKGAARATQSATQELIDAGKIKTGNQNYAADQAERLGKYRTFQDDGKLSKALTEIHDILNMLVGVGDSGKKLGKMKVHAFGAGDIVAPFARIAANLTTTGIDYSPFNAVKGTAEIISSIADFAKNKAVDPAKQAKGVSDLARGLTGTAIATAAMVLAKSGLLRRADDEGDEDVAKLNQSEGITGTQVNVDALNRALKGGDASWQSGDTLLDVSRIEPLNYLLTFGFELNSIEDEDNGIIGTFKAAGKSAYESTADLPVVSNFADLAKDIFVYHKKPGEAAAQAIGNTIVSSITPNAVAAFAKGNDDKYRDVHSGDGVVDPIIDTLKSRVPGLREKLPTSVNALGEEKGNPGSWLQRMTNAMVNPVGVNQFSQSDVSREMRRVREETGKVDFFPTARKPKEIEYTVDGVKHSVPLNYDERQQFQKDAGTTQMEITEKIIKSSYYKSASDEVKAELLKRGYDYAYQKAKLDKVGKDASETWAENAADAKKKYGMTTEQYLIALEQYGGVKGVEKHIKTENAAKQTGMAVDSFTKLKEAESAAVKAKNANSDTNHSMWTKNELMGYIDKNYPESQRHNVFDTYTRCSNLNWKNPY